MYGNIEKGEYALEPTENIIHEIKLSRRSELNISGVDDVIGFDDTAISVATSMGILNIEGNELHIVRLDVDKGALEVSGHFDAIYYTDPKVKSRGIFSGMMR